MELLEREPLLASLRTFHAGAGCLVFVSGEAGIGKSALVRSFCDGLPAATAVHFGFCDALGTPRALGPVYDIARTHPEGLGRLLGSGADRHTLFTAFLDLLAAGPSVTVIEDAHWADEATLDLLLFLGRRIAGLPATVVVTYRGNDLDRDHPLRRVLGDLATSTAVQRLVVPPLSEQAVATLAEPAGRDGAELHGLTGGNPFFVTEALSVPARHLPATVRDAVLVRAARLGTAARAVLDVVALVPDRAELALLEDVAGAGAVGLDDAVRSGMLVIEGPTVHFRHELARRAVEEDVPAARAAARHARILAFLAGVGTADPARLAYHAEAAGDSPAVLRFASTAGRAAAALGAHREAVGHLARALRHAAGAPPSERAALWELRAGESDRSGDLAGSLDSAGRAAELWRAAGEIEREASVLARRSHVLWSCARRAEAHASARTAVEMLERLPPGAVLGQAYAARARLLMLAQDSAEAIAVGSAAIEVAERYGDTATLGRALNAVGSAHWTTDPQRAVELLTGALDAAHRAEDDQAAAAILNNLGSGAGESRDYVLADRWLAEGVSWSTARDLDPSRNYGRAWQARVHFEQGRWDEAGVLAAEVVEARAQHVPSRIVALTVLGWLRVRRGDPDAEAPLEQAWELAERAGDVMRLWPVAAARAESAVLGGHPERIEELTGETYRYAVRVGHGWAAGELGHRLGITEPPTCAARPWAMLMRGESTAAAALWRELGCPYEAALAQADGDDPDRQLAAVHELQRLGAWPAAEVLARRLRESGVSHVPRRPRRATLDNPGQLTTRQLDVLGLVADGLRNAEIAARLHLSAKTVDHHVSAILAKLGVGSRTEAARWARDPGRVT